MSCCSEYAAQTNQAQLSPLSERLAVAEVEDEQKENETAGETNSDRKVSKEDMAAHVQ